MLVADWGGSFLRLLVPSWEGAAVGIQKYNLDAGALQPGPYFASSLRHVLEQVPDNVQGRALLIMGLTGEQLLKPPPCEDLRFSIEFRSVQLDIRIYPVTGREEIVGELHSCLMVSGIMEAPPICAMVAFGSSSIRAAFQQENGTYSIKEIVPGGRFLSKSLTNVVASICEETMRDDLLGLTDPPVIYLLGGFSYGIRDFDGELGLGPIDGIAKSPSEVFEAFKSGLTHYYARAASSLEAATVDGDNSAQGGTAFMTEAACLLGMALMRKLHSKRPDLKIIVARVLGNIPLGWYGKWFYDADDAEVQVRSAERLSFVKYDAEVEELI